MKALLRFDMDDPDERIRFNRMMRAQELADTLDDFYTSLRHDSENG